MDVAPSVMMPTWNNRRVGDGNIFKRLDRFLLSSDMLDIEFFYGQWVGSGGESDHHPVFFQISNRGAQLKTPFKFNPHWLENEDLVNTLTASWVVYDDNLLETHAS